MTSDLKKYIDSSAIKNKIQLLADSLNQEYDQKEVIVVGVLKGCICFLSDLIKELKFTFSIEFVQAKSYGMRGANPKDDVILEPFDFEVKNKNLILLDDIFDRGLTLYKIYQSLLANHPKNIKTVVLLKKTKKQIINFQPDDFLFEIEDKFVVGYGLDYMEKYRGLNGIYTIG